MSARTTSAINRGWLYAPVGLTDSGRPRASAPAQSVALPHPNVVLPAQGFDDRDYQFLSSYRRRLRLAPDLAGRRAVVRFQAVMSAARVFCNGHLVTQHRGGFVPFSCDLTSHLRWDGEDELAVEVDSTERPDIPPFGGHVDYLTYGGIYRGVDLELLPLTGIGDVFVRPRDVLTPDRCIEVRYRLETRDDRLVAPGDPVTIEARVRDGDKTLHTAVSDPVAGVSGTEGEPGSVEGTVILTDLADLELWDVDHPRLYDVEVVLRSGPEVLDTVTVRTGLREARFEAGGFFLNGRHLKLRGLNRHQTYPHVGAAMPARMQRRDAEILRTELKCNAVRTAHYPQDPAFLDACDELGLLVFEEMPGWQHVGDLAWQELACRDVEAMVTRDRNHPSVVLWGVRVNESFDHEDFYRKTNAIAHRLDDSRQTSGVRYFPESQLLEDVFALNDFQTGGVIDGPNHPRYLISEFAGHMFPTKRYDNVERVQDHALLHATVLNAAYGDDGIAGAFGWCAFDYATHAEFGSGNRVCYHGVADMFRFPKPAAGLYRSQCPSAEELVLEPAFSWAGGDHSDYGGPGQGVIFSNCTRIVATVAGEVVAELEPDRERFPHLPHPPFFFGQASGIAPWRRSWGDLRLDGFLGEELVATRVLSGRGVDADLLVSTDHSVLLADGADTTRLSVRVTDEHGNDRPFTTGAVLVDVRGPLVVVGDNPLPLTGGAAAVYLRATDEPGDVEVSVTHPTLGTSTVELTVQKAGGERW